MVQYGRRTSEVGGGVNVLVDVHHADLLEAMHRLFEDRLGMTVYVPYGMEWFEQGYAPYGSEPVARQFLVDAALHTDFHPRKIRFLPLSAFRLMEWGVVCATMAEQQWGFKRLADEKGARFAVQVGNTRQYVDYSLDPVVIDVAQEFDIEGAFRYTPFTGSKSVASFVNIFPVLPDYRHFEEARALLNGWRIAVHGHHGPDGFIKPTSAIADLMRGFAFGWHDKETGDGFGHVIHQWASVGRPLIGHASYYRGQMAEDLWEDLNTCIDLDRHTIPDTVALMEEIVADPDRHAEMCFNIAQRVRERIDFAADAERVSEALGLKVPA